MKAGHPLLSRRAALASLGTVGMTGVALRQVVASDADDGPRALYHALASQPAERIDVGGATVSLVFADDAPGLNRAAVRDWISLAASAIAAYFGRFPIRTYGVLVIATDGARIAQATTFGFNGPATSIHVGRDADEPVFHNDWILVHEMMHAVSPDLPRRALWLQEGSATWLEPVARAQVGNLPISDVWTQAVRGMPKGEPEADEAGLDGTDRWGRLYWGGATFWLEAEIAIWVQSGGRKSLIDAMRAIAQPGGGNAVIWSPERWMRVGDAACAVNALLPLYQRYASKRVAPDLPALFDRLGVSRSVDGTVVLDPHAELAALTTRITQRQAPARQPITSKET